MKRLLKMIILFTSIIVILFCAKNTEKKEIERVMEEPFQYGINLDQKTNSEEVIEKLYELCNEYNLTIVRPLESFKDMDYYIYSSGDEFQKNILNVNSQLKDKILTNIKENKDEVLFNMFYNLKINFKPLSDLKNIKLTGNYNIYSTDIENFINNIDKINSDYENYINLSLDKNFNFLGDRTLLQNQIDLFLILSIIMIFFEIILTIYLINSKKRDFAIKMLNGISYKNIIKKTYCIDILKIFAVYTLLGICLGVVYFYFANLFENINTLLILLKNLNFLFIYIVIYLVISFLYLFFKVKNIKISDIPIILKSGEKNGNFLNFIATIFSIVFVIGSIFVVFPNYQYLKNQEKNLNNWEKYGDYNKISYWVPTKTIENEDEQFRTESHLANLWKVLDKEG